MIARTFEVMLELILPQMQRTKVMMELTLDKILEKMIKKTYSWFSNLYHPKNLITLSPLSLPLKQGQARSQKQSELQECRNEILKSPR